jgi:hypothetical protein
MDPAFDCFAVGDTSLGHPNQVVCWGCGLTGVVGRVRQVDPEAHPYLLLLLLGPASKLSPAFQLPCQSERQVRVRRKSGLPSALPVGEAGTC